jgi:hypothetical protein
MSLDSIVFIQQIRTPSSEIWLADLSRQSQEAFAQIDIHYLADHVEATVCLLKPLKNEEILHKFLNMIDDELIAAGDLVKGNLRFRVIHGGVNVRTEVLEREPRPKQPRPGGLADSLNLEM